jgi:Ca-activated chloride channel homolog
MIFEYFKNISFGQPWFFALSVLLPLLVVWYMAKHNKQASAIAISTVEAPGLGSWKASLRHLPFVLRLLALAAIIVALARPQTTWNEQVASGEGIDIVLCLDVSGSMKAQDLKPNRLEAAKAVAIDFVKKRVTDRIGVVIFSGESFTQCPLTTNYAVLEQAIAAIRSGLLEEGTAIGSGLGTSVERLRASQSKTKVVVLITDGVDNGGRIIDPNTAKEIAKAFGVRVYAIGVGTDGSAATPTRTALGDTIMDIQPVAIDERLLTQIAVETGGKYFRAKDNEGLKNVYAEIDGFEKTAVDITTTTKYLEKFAPFALAALALLLLELLLRHLVFKKFP